MRGRGLLAAGWAVALVGAAAVAGAGVPAHAAPATPSSTTASVPEPAGYVPPHVGHVWVIELENKAFGEAFTETAGNSYLARTLPSQGALLRQYYGTGHLSLDNYISETSGQAPNAVTQSDCQRYVDVVGSASPLAGQYAGQGCVFPSTVKNVADQLEEHGDTWHEYAEDLGNDPARDHTSSTDPTCGIPGDSTPPLGTADGTQSATATDQYAARHDPFLYYADIAKTARCSAHIGPLTPLAHDLTSVATTPTYSFITPNLCDDAHDATCVGTNLSGSSDSMVAHQGGLVAANYFLERYVPMITASPAFKQDGLLVVTLDESTFPNGPSDQAGSCCGELPGPGSPLPGISGTGGGLIGTVLISPFIRPGTVSDEQYNHYSLLRSLEDELRLGATADIPGSDGQGHLGYAGQAGLETFHDDVFDTGSTATTGPTAPAGTTTTAPATAAPPTDAAGPGGGELAFTGERAVAPVVALLLLGGAGAAAAAGRRRR